MDGKREIYTIISVATMPIDSSLLSTALSIPSRSERRIPTRQLEAPESY